MSSENDIDRLTDREKECLRQWLEHKTAKEIALDLGVSHHAVEKRLKMARTKLSVATSLEAARLLAEAEGYDPTVAQSPDLARKPDVQHFPEANRKFASGVIVMSLATLAILAAFYFEGPSIEPDGTADALSDADAQSAARIEARPSEVLVFIRAPFDDLDTDSSGYLEDEEGPMVAFMGGDVELSTNADGSVDWTADSIRLSNEEERGNFYRLADADSDGRVSRDEYRQWAAAKPVSDSLNPVEARRRQTETHVEGTPSDIQTYAQERFAELDADRSGFIEQGEAPPLMVQFTSATWDREGSPPEGWLERQEFNRVPLSPQMARAAYIAQGDADADGKLSRAEYFALREGGFDAHLIPAEWREERARAR